MQRHRFDLLMQLDKADIRLDCAALHIATDVYPYISVCKYISVLDELAERIADERPGLSAPRRYEAMRSILVDCEEFTGNDDDYSDPENHYLNRVLERRVGVPISLAIVWIEVARRLKWRVNGIGFPGHFLIRFDDRERFIVVDPFHRGRTLTVRDCRGILAQQSDGNATFNTGLLQPVGTRHILARSLHNLRSLYIAQQDWNRLEFVLRRLAALEPKNGRYVQELAALRYSLGDVRSAYAHLNTYIQTRPSAMDLSIVRRQRDHLAAAIVALN